MPADAVAAPSGGPRGTDPSSAGPVPVAGRQGLLLAVVRDVVASVRGEGPPTRVLDCGGGSGALAVPLAVDGADVTVLDISADALATLRRRAVEAGVADRVHPLQGDAEAMQETVAPGSFDLVLVHGLLEAVDDPARAVAGIAAAVRPGGLVSVVVANPVSAVLARALAGDPSGALRELHRLDDADRLGPDAVEVMFGAAGLVVEARDGIGVFSDLVPGATLDTQGAREALAALDASAASRSPFAQIAGRVHLRIRRPAG